jgi:hypothetical protein
MLMTKRQTASALMVMCLPHVNAGGRCWRATLSGSHAKVSQHGAQLQFLNASSTALASHRCSQTIPASTRSLFHRPGKAGVGSDEAECTFAPAINERSRKLLARSMELPSSFLERQQYLAALAAEKRALYRSVVEAEECSFTPAVRSTSVSPTPSRQGSLAASGHWARYGAQGSGRRVWYV